MGHHKRYSLFVVAGLLPLLAAGCATSSDAEVQHRTQSMHHGRYLLSVTDDAPGSFYELGVYVLDRGDTLFKIARQFHISVSDIMAINPGLDGRHLFVGQRIRIYERRRE